MKNTKIFISLILLLTVTSILGCNVSIADAQSESHSLRELADKCGIWVGTTVDELMKPSAHPLLLENFNKVTIEAFHWRLIRPDKDSYDFSGTDYSVNTALKNNIRQLEAHHLVWAAQLPGWLTHGNFTRDELIEILREHIMTVVGRYKGKVTTWSVVNEVYTYETIDPAKNFWYRRIGPEYIEMAFRWAKEADPNAVLIWNDYSNEDRVDPARRNVIDLTYNKIKELKSKGVPIDGMGMQMHLHNPFIPAQIDPNKSEVIKNMKRFGELGLKVYITEFDVNLNDLQDMPRAKRWAYQARLYGDMLEASLESGVCESFSIFGLSDTRSWYDVVKIKNAEPLPFDKNYHPKPAYYALLDVLSKHCEQRNNVNKKR